MKTFALAEVDRAEREAAILRHLASKHGKFRTQSLAPSSTPGTLATRWLQGRKKSYIEITEAEWQALGATLAALHDALDDLPVTLPSLPPIARDLDVASARARTTSAEIHRYLDARVALFERHAEPARRLPGIAGRPIHGDYNQHNYLFDEVLPPMVLDWDRALSAPREYEVVRCLNHLPLVAPANATAFVCGYREARELDPSALRWAVERTLVDHAMKSWPLERWLDGAAGAETMLRGSMEVLLALRDGSDRLASFFEDAAR